MIKSYTDISQSKKLAEILPIESADMCFQYQTDRWVGEPDYNEFPQFEHVTDKRDVPCWSLASLLGVLPDELGDNHFLTLDKEGNEYCCCYEDVNGNSFRHTFADNPIDACVAMIEKLHEHKML